MTLIFFNDSQSNRREMEIFFIICMYLFNHPECPLLLLESYNYANNDDSISKSNATMKENGFGLRRHCYLFSFMIIAE